jgi:hypothetical protein
MLQRRRGEKIHKRSVKFDVSGAVFDVTIDMAEKTASKA